MHCFRQNAALGIPTESPAQAVEILLACSSAQVSTDKKRDTPLLHADQNQPPYLLLPRYIPFNPCFGLENGISPIVSIKLVKEFEAWVPQAISIV